MYAVNIYVAHLTQTCFVIYISGVAILAGPRAIMERLDFNRSTHTRALKIKARSNEEAYNSTQMVNTLVWRWSG